MYQKLYSSTYQSPSMVKTEQGKSFQFTILLDLDGQEQRRCILYCLKPFIRSISLSIKFISHKSNPTLNTSFEFSLGFRETVCDLFNIEMNKLKESLNLEHGGNDKAVPEHSGEAGGVQGRGQGHIGHLGEL